MILLKFFGWVFIGLFALGLFFRLFGKPLSKLLLRYFMKRAQRDLEKQARVYDQYVDGHSPFEDNVFVDGDTKVSIKRGQSSQERQSDQIDDSFIEEVEFEDLD